MALPALTIARDYHPSGEYHFSPTRLALSVSLGRCALEMRFDGRVWQGTSVPGDMKVMPMGQARTFRHREGCHFIFIGIEHARVVGDGSAGVELRPRAVLRDLPLRHVVDALLAESDHGPTTTLFQQAVGAAIVARLRELDGVRYWEIGHRLTPRALASVLEFLDAHLAEDLSVADLASVAGLSPAHFSMLFRNSTGEPPHRYHTRLRVERARRLLERGAKPSDAALAVGFFDHSHLTRHMRKLLGIGPALLRRQR